MSLEVQATGGAPQKPLVEPRKSELDIQSSGQIGAEILVDLVTDAGTGREGALQRPAVEAAGNLGRRCIVGGVVGATELRPVIVDVAANVPAAKIGRLLVGDRRRRLLDHGRLHEIGGEYRSGHAREQRGKEGRSCCIEHACHP